MGGLAPLGVALKHAYTLFLFTKSDFKTVVFPVTLMAAASAPLTTSANLLHSFFWVWLHLLQFDVSNQTLNPVEDEHNKRDRPLPAKRISLKNAIILRWALVPVCWSLSACYGKNLAYTSLALTALTAFHNELHAHRHIVGKNVATALCISAFEVGAILLSGNSRDSFGRVAQVSLVCSVMIFTTTTYAQDFKDVDGDALVGRKTVPIRYPTLAGPILAATLQAWSAFLVLLWQVDLTTTVLFGTLSVCTALSFVTSRTVLGYQRAYYIYNAWIVFAHCLPLFQRRDPRSSI